MLNKKFFILLFITFFKFPNFICNYGFYRKVANTCKYYRVEIDEKKMQLTKNADGSYNFSIEMKSLRNNFEMVMLVGFISVGQAITHQESFAKKTRLSTCNSGDTEVTVTVPVSRESTIITAKATVDDIRQLSRVR